MNKREFNRQLKRKCGYTYNPDKPLTVRDVEVWLEHQPDKTVEIAILDRSRGWWIGDPKYMPREVAIDYLHEYIMRVGQ